MVLFNHYDGCLKAHSSALGRDKACVTPMTSDRQLLSLCDLPTHATLLGGASAFCADRRKVKGVDGDSGHGCLYTFVQ